MKNLPLLFLPFALAACTTAPKTAAKPDDVSTKATAAVTAPLNDLNLVKVEIPPVLLAAQAAPYEVPQPGDCPALTAQIKSLDAVLEPDLDQPVKPDTRSMSERGSDEAGDAAFDALRRTAEGVVPFRGWLRKLSGAESHARSVVQAVLAGNVRRAFLKGVGQALNCPVPARPVQAPRVAAAASAPQH